MRFLLWKRQLRKKGLVIKNTPLAILNMQMFRRKVLFMKTSQTWPNSSKTFFFFFFSSDIFSSGLFFAAPYHYRKKSSRILLPITFCPMTSENWNFSTKDFIFRLLFQELFFPWLFFTKIHTNIVNIIKFLQQTKMFKSLISCNLMVETFDILNLDYLIYQKLKPENSKVYEIGLQRYRD